MYLITSVANVNHVEPGLVLEEITVAQHTRVEKAKEIATPTQIAREDLYAEPTTVEHLGIHATQVFNLLMIVARSGRVAVAATLAVPMGIVNGEKATATATTIVLMDFIVELTIADT